MAEVKRWVLLRSRSASSKFDLILLRAVRMIKHKQDGVKEGIRVIYKIMLVFVPRYAIILSNALVH